MASHIHSRGQLTLTLLGTLQVELPAGTMTIPSGKAVWIPAGTEHAERLNTGASLLTLRLDPSLTAAAQLLRSRTFTVAPLLRELAFRIAARGGVDGGVPEDVRLAQVLVDEILVSQDAALDLPAPRDPRALQLSRLVEDAPAERSSISTLAGRVGASRRTLERIFQSETGMSVGEWRQRLRLHHALRLLAERRPLADVAAECGYGSATAFILAFKKRFGVTPHRYRALDPEARRG
jgi:AraC-like DNA-binding protein